MIDDGVQRIPTGHFDDQLIADAVAILGEDGETGQVVVHLVLAADGQRRTDEPGTGEEERGVDREEVEDGDDHADPDRHRDQVVEHPCRGVGTLTAPLFPRLGGFDADT